MVLKWLLLIALFFLVFWLLKPFRQKKQRSSNTTSSKVEDMVRCAQCGVHLPESESITRDGQSFCNVEHYQRYLQSHRK